MGSSDAHISLTVRSRENLLGVEIYIPDNKELYAYLETHKDQIESELGEELEWMALPTKKACRIRVSSPGGFGNEEKWNDDFTWFFGKVESFLRVFPKYIKAQNKPLLMSPAI